MKSPKFSGPQRKPKAFLIRRVVGKSMLPTLRPGQIVIASGLFRQPQIDSVVIVRHDNLEKIKRVRVVDNGRVFIVGDNNRGSIDSRVFGWLPEESVIGKVIWPRI